MRTDQAKLLIFFILVVSFLGYSFQIYSHRYVKEPEVPAPVVLGKRLWQKYNCGSCHQFYGLGGHLGPDLTNVSGRRSNAYIEVFLKNGTPVMPDFKLSEEEITAFLAFFEEIDKTGNSDPRTFQLHLHGTITQP